MMPSSARPAETPCVPRLPPPSAAEAQPSKPAEHAAAVTGQDQMTTAQPSGAHTVDEKATPASPNPGESSASSVLASSPLGSLLGSANHTAGGFGTAAFSAGSLDKHRIGICALVAVAPIFSFMAWFEVDSSTVQASSYASQGANYLSQLAGQNNDYSSNLSYNESYNVWNLGDAGSVAANYQDIYDSVSGYNSDDNGVVSITNPNYGESSISDASALVTGTWAIGLVAAIAGAVLVFTKGRNVVLYVGCASLALSAVIFEVFYASTMRNIGSPTIFPVLMAFCAAGAFALNLTLRNPDEVVA